MNRSDERGPWYLLTGLVLGVALGLAYAWSVQPVRYTDTAPESLRREFKDQYRALIASAYIGNADLTRAQARLQLLGDEDASRALTEQAQRTLAENGSDREAQALGLLAIALGQAPPGPGQVVTQPGQPPTRPALTGPSPTPSGRTPGAETETVLSPTNTTLPATNTPEATAAQETGAADLQPTNSTPVEIASPTAVIPTLAASTAVPGGSFILLSQERICDERLDKPVFRIEALDRFNTPVAGVAVIVTWTDGEERFFTGLKPEKGLGYADFIPEPGVLYTLRLGEAGAPVTDLAGVMCSQPTGAPTWGAWLLKFVQP